MIATPYYHSIELFGKYSGYFLKVYTNEELYHNITIYKYDRCVFEASTKNDYTENQILEICGLLVCMLLQTREQTKRKIQDNFIKSFFDTERENNDLS